MRGGGGGGGVDIAHTGGSGWPFWLVLALGHGVDSALYQWPTVWTVLGPPLSRKFWWSLHSVRPHPGSGAPSSNLLLTSLLQGRAAKGDLTKLKNDELKLYCTLHGLPKSGNKTQLIERITEHLQQAVATLKGK